MDLNKMRAMISGKAGKSSPSMENINPKVIETPVHQVEARDVYAQPVMTYPSHEESTIPPTSYQEVPRSQMPPPSKETQTLIVGYDNIGNPVCSQVGLDIPVSPSVDNYGRPLYVPPTYSTQPSIPHGMYPTAPQPNPYQRQTINYTPPAAVATYTAPLTPKITPSKEVLNRVIGLPEDLGEFEITTYTGLSVEAIDIKEIRDTSGKLSQIIQAYEDEYDLSVVPLDCTTLLPEVIELSAHDIIELGGRRYASSRERIVNTIRLKSYIDKVYESLSTGIVFTDSLWEDRRIGDTEFKTFKFNKFELENICGAYRNYNPKVIVSKNGHQLLIIGDKYGLVK